ncbi:MAG: hypothetical protein RLZZ370_1526 [Bacteroidota bacterium]
MSRTAKLSIWLWCLLMLPQVHAQQESRVRSIGPVPLDAGQDLSIQVPEPFDCFVLRVQGPTSPAFLLMDGDTLLPDPHAPDAYVQFLPQFKKAAVIQLPVAAQLTVFFMEVGSVGVQSPATLRNNMPAVIPQSQWRMGLNPPKPGPVATHTRHAIVHHSAGNTNESDFVKVVRSYYLLHTEVNGWDDIGYNYLIASDGSIFAGRDPQGLAGVKQDNVRGAHFCGKNEYTMGVCIIGDYTQVQPPFPAVNSLCRLLAWKMQEDGLIPFDSARHPNPNGGFLGTLAGHRDGCSTECPGDKVYAQVEAIRECVVLRLSSLESLDQKKQVFHLHREGNMLHISSLSEEFEAAVFSTDGRLVQTGKGTNGSLSMHLHQPALYFVQLRSNLGLHYQKLPAP